MQDLQYKQKRRKMSLQKKPALRRNFSEEKMVRPKDNALPTLVKGQDLNTSSPNIKRHNFEPFKLRILNGQEKKAQGRQDPPTPHPKQNKEEIFQKNASPFVSNDRQLINQLQVENMLDPFLKEIRPKLKKRRTLNMGEFLSNSSADSKSQSSEVQSNNSQQQIQERAERPSLLKRISRKYSLTTILTTNTSEIRELGIVEKRSNFCNREAKKQVQKVLFYHQFLQKQAELHDITLRPIHSYEDQRIHYTLGKGNNRQILKEAMVKRWWWKEAEQNKGHFVNFLWTQLKDMPFIIRNEPNHPYSSSESLEEENERSSKSSETEGEAEVATRTLHNHFECNKYLGSKLSLYLSIKSYCQLKGLGVCEFLLPTFYVCRFMDDEWKSFTKAYFQRLQISRIDNWDVNINKKYWMIKQFNADGITNKVFTTYKQIKQHVEREAKNGSRFLIQKYLSKPFLYKRRKFDIRTYALVVRLKEKINVYLHKEGVINTATEMFDMAELDNQFAHITTESVQIKSKKFGEYQPGNKIDFHTFQSYLEAGYGDKYNFMQHAFPRMQEVLSHFAGANYALIGKSRRGACFELLQCEFTMDEDFKPWLIDVHTNPCLETYCVVLEKVLPQVIEDTLRHTADVLFPPPLEWPESKHHLLDGRKKEDGFVLIFDESKLEEKETVHAQELQGKVQSDRDEYVDDLIDDCEEMSNSQRLSGLEYLLNELE